jgi:hypothetical protein
MPTTSRRRAAVVGAGRVGAELVVALVGLWRTLSSLQIQDDRPRAPPAGGPLRLGGRYLPEPAHRALVASEASHAI